MRTGISFSVTSADLDRLRAVINDRNAPQKHVWRAQIVLLSAEGLGTNAIIRETGKSMALMVLTSFHLPRRRESETSGYRRRGNRRRLSSAVPSRPLVGTVPGSTL
jgi:hypothetical protein